MPAAQISGHGSLDVPPDDETCSVMLHLPEKGKGFCLHVRADIICKRNAMAYCLVAQTADRKGKRKVQRIDCKSEDMPSHEDNFTKARSRMRGHAFNVRSCKISTTVNWIR